jgi:ATP-binding cassette, subfamily B, bacterial MsbA
MSETSVDGANGIKPSKSRLRVDERTSVLIRRFWREWLSHRKGELAVSFLLMTLLAATSGAYSQIVKDSFDALVPPSGAGNSPAAPNLTSLWWVVGLIIVVTNSRSVLLYLQTVATNRTVLRISVDIQRACFAHLLKADYARIARDTPGHLVSRLTNDIGALQTATQALITTSVRDVLMVLASVGWMAYTDWQLTLIVLVVYPIAAIPIMSISERLRKVARRTQEELGDMTSQLIESLSGARLIKTFRLEDYAAGRTNQSFEEIYSLRMKAVRSKGAIDPLLEMLGGFALAGVTVFVGYRISSGLSSVGAFMGFITALILAAQPIRGFGGLVPKLQEGMAALVRVYELLDEPPAIADSPEARPLALSHRTIDFQSVTFAYVEKAAIRDFSLCVPGGSTVALVGRSGAGKTTVLNLVPRLFEPQSGRILIDGQDLRTVTLASLRDSIAIVSQDTTLFNDTVRENIALGRLDASDADIRHAAKSAAALEFIEQLPKGFQTIIGDRGMSLSGGQRQRLALARAILKDAPILLLDEATSALDQQSERLVQDALAEFSRGRTTLVIAHRLSTVQNADLICVMEDGTIMEQGTHSELLARGQVYARLYNTSALDLR